VYLCTVVHVADNNKIIVLQASDGYIVDHKADNTDIVLFLCKASSGFAVARMNVSCSLHV